jgi:nucleotide-binding universal stress UspA family protein
MQIKTILVSTDGSEHAHKAVELGSDLARLYEARLVLLHVLLRDTQHAELQGIADVRLSDATQEELQRLETDVQTAIATGGIGAVPIPVIVPREVLEEVGRQILDAAEAVAKAAGVQRVERVVDDGDPAKRILAHAERVAADMLVLGSRGLSDIKGLFVGSVSHKVSHLAECTCVTVK